MKLKDVVATLNQIRSQKVNVSKARTEVMVSLVDAYSFFKLGQLISRWEAEGERDVLLSDFEAIDALLSQRWIMTQRTNAEYFMNPLGRATVVFREVAEYASNVLQANLYASKKIKSKSTPWLGLMVPTLKREVAAVNSNKQFDFYHYCIKKNLEDLVNIQSAYKGAEINRDLDASIIARVKAHDPNTTKLDQLKINP